MSKINSYTAQNQDEKKYLKETTNIDQGFLKNANEYSIWALKSHDNNDPKNFTIKRLAMQVRTLLGYVAHHVEVE